MNTWYIYNNNMVIHFAKKLIPNLYFSGKYGIAIVEFSWFWWGPNVLKICIELVLCPSIPLQKIFLLQAVKITLKCPLNNFFGWPYILSIAIIIDTFQFSNSCGSHHECKSRIPGHDLISLVTASFACPCMPIGDSCLWDGYMRLDQSRMIAIFPTLSQVMNPVAKELKWHGIHASIS